MEIVGDLVVVVEIGKIQNGPDRAGCLGTRVGFQQLATALLHL